MDNKKDAELSKLALSGVITIEIAILKLLKMNPKGLKAKPIGEILDIHYANNFQDVVISFFVKRLESEGSLKTHKKLKY